MLPSTTKAHILWNSLILPTRSASHLFTTAFDTQYITSMNFASAYDPPHHGLAPFHAPIDIYKTLRVNATATCYPVIFYYFRLSDGGVASFAPADDLSLNFLIYLVKLIVLH